MSAWDLYGPNLGLSKVDPGWDAVHVLAPGEKKVTLCGQNVEDVGSACSLDTGYKPSSFDGCWTCLQESNQWATSRG